MRKKIILIFTILILLLLLVFSPTIKKSILDSFIKNEINKNSITLDFNENKNTIVELLKDDIKNNEIFFVGEFHGVSTSIKLHLDFIKFFAENADVRYILFEGGYTMGQLLNEFLISGDYEILHSIMNSLNGTSSYTEEQYNLFAGIYEYNKTLPKDKKLIFVGIDIEHQPVIALNYIKSLIPKTKSPEDINEYFELLNKTNLINFLMNTKQIATAIKENENSFKEYLGDNFFDFYFSINNLSISMPGLSHREQYIKNNFTTLYERLPKGKYFGQFGATHTMQYGYINQFDSVSLANYLDNEYEDTKNKVISIFPSFNNCYALEQNYVINEPIKNELPKSFFPKDEVTKLVKLNYKDSPFSKYKLLVDDAPTTEYYEYLLLISNSSACKIYTKDSK